METASPVQAHSGRLREEVASAVREIIAVIKNIPEGPAGVPEDAPLFNDGLSEPSPFELDSLDALDLALALKERFDPEGDRFEAFLDGDVDMQQLSTVRKITDYIISLASTSDTEGTASTRMEPATIQTSTDRASKGGF